MRGGFVVVVLLVGCASPRTPDAPRTEPSAPAAGPVTPEAPEPAAEAPGSPLPATPPSILPPRVEPLPRYDPMPSNTPRPPGPPLPERGPTPEEERACAARGGKMQRICMLGELACVLRFRDGGKRCTDGSECFGKVCLWQGEGEPPARGSGGCVRTSDPCGCRATITGGAISPPMCAD